jgi:hypothetical protein
MSAKKLKTSRSAEDNHCELDDLVSAAAHTRPVVLVRARDQPPPVFNHVSVTITRRLQQIHNIDMAGDLYHLHRELSLLDRATRTLVVDRCSYGSFFWTLHSPAATPVTLGGPDVLDPAFLSTTQAPTCEDTRTKNAPE